MSRIFLVDDHTIVRDGIRAMLAAEPTIEIVGEASNGQELLDSLPTTPTDVVLLDANMPVLDGLATTLRLRAEYPEVRILVLSMLAHERYIGQLFDAGASGYVLKSAEKAEILVAIQTVIAGRQFLCSELGLSILRKILVKEEGEEEVTKAHKLSRRETEVLQLLAGGLTTNEIAEKLFTSKRTVETHRQNILEKTQTKNTAALIHLAVTQGLLD
ncbi:response regulator transcription factor [Hymenobacter sp. UV11]|uniref:response regulator n=1 Tax=Hymenobacter sp. UV11 TaxID=1849735 RepID=UPI00105EC548|nr:response regulator transcription factor [Hymenobacter sp. UV11]TDN40053.1 DNA-binding response regulator [Hymenobacter sp. UV11]TFZ64032.1 response regulator transcription factor [Hymenobacter sp. UV11]